MAFVYERRHPNAAEQRVHRQHAFAAQNERFRARRERAETAMGQARLAADLLDARSQMRDLQADAYTTSVAVAATQIGAAQRAARRLTAETGVRAQVAVQAWNAHADLTETRSRCISRYESDVTARVSRSLPTAPPTAASCKTARQLPSQWKPLHKPRGIRGTRVCEFAYEDEEDRSSSRSAQPRRFRQSLSHSATVRIEHGPKATHDDRGSRFRCRPITVDPITVPASARGLATGRHTAKRITTIARQRPIVAPRRPYQNSDAAKKNKTLRGLAWLEQIESGAIALSLR